MRIELTTYALRVRCSTPELPGRVLITTVYCHNRAGDNPDLSGSIGFLNMKHFPKTQVP